MDKYEEMGKANINAFCERLTEALLRGRVDLVAEIKCEDGIYRNRPLIDVATALATMEDVRKEMTK